MIKNNERGAAIVMALSFFVVVSFVVLELSKESLTESALASQGVRRLRSYYAAKAGFELSLLRIHAYRQAKAQVAKLGSSAEGFDAQLRMIWEFPFAWPPVLPDNVSTVAKDGLKKVLTGSLMKKIAFYPEIRDAGTKVDINSLGSPIKPISDKSKATLLLSFERLLENDEELASTHTLDSIEEVLNNVADWVDPDDEAKNGGSESSQYTQDDQRGYPRNKAFMTFDELMLVDLMDEILFDRLSKLSTLRGTFGVNINTASKLTFISLDSSLTEEDADRFLERRNEIQNTGEQLNEQTFDSILRELGTNLESFNPDGVPILYSPLSAFFVESIGESGNIKTTITGYILDPDSLKEIFISQLDQQDKNARGGSTAQGPNATGSGSGAQPTTGGTNTTPNTNPPSANNNTPLPKGRPFIMNFQVK